MKRKIIAVVFATALLSGVTSPAFADPSPPTNGGNGAGQSGQCTGTPSERPHSCKHYS